MKNRAKDHVHKAFAEIHPDNPLGKLNELDRTVLWALLGVYGFLSTERKERGIANDLERLSRIMADAAKLGSELEAEVLGLSEQMRQLFAGYEDVPSRLVKLSTRSEKTLNFFGKPGHKGKTLSNRFLILSSEFVWLKTGQYNDEHLAELFQEIGMHSEAEELSGDAIRKKREYLKKNNPDFYAYVLEQAKRMAVHQALAAAAAQPIPDTLNAALSGAGSHSGTSTPSSETPAAVPLLERT